MWHPISNAPFDRDLELGVADSHSVRVIPFPCRRILGGWIKAETKTRIDVCPTHWREWSTDRNAPRSPRATEMISLSIGSNTDFEAPRAG